MNDINQIDTNVFNDLSNLESLNLDSNQIFTLKKVQFNSKLTKLSIQFNFISDLNEINSTSLRYLHLSNNRIQEINLISLLPNLEHLDLSKNRLIKIQETSFKGLKQLKNFNLSFNKLELNGISYYKEQILLETLDLSFNEIKYLVSNLTFLNLDSLKRLNLSNNLLQSLNSFTFGHLIKLESLNLAYNDLKLLNPNCFFNLNNLLKLGLGFNQIQTFDFLKYNKENLENLEILEIEQNKILLIQENDFDFNRQLVFLNLNSNPLKNISTKAFNSLIKLKTLKISKTNINRLTVRKSFKELDLGFLLNVSVSNKEALKNIELSLNGKKTKILRCNPSDEDSSINIVKIFGEFVKIFNE